MIRRDRLVNTFCDLVRIDSPSGEEEGIARELDRRLAALGFTVSRDAHGNLIASDGGEAPLLLSAHMDTVEPGRGIVPQVVGDKIYSDGTTILGGDCKAGVAAIVEALESVHEDGVRRAPLELVFTRGEEVGLEGARNLDFSMMSARAAVVFDGNGPVCKVTTASPTYVRFDIHVKGVAAHAGVEPEKGLSAIRIAAEIINSLPQGRLDAETTINVGTISGGTVRNAVPEEAKFSGEFRSRNAETLDLVRLQVLEVIETVRRRYHSAVVQEELGVDFNMYKLTPDDPMVTWACDVLKTLNMEPELGPTGGGTDANIFNENGIQSVVVGMSTNEMHTTREFVVIPDLMDTARFCEALVTTLAQASN